MPACYATSSSWWNILINSYQYTIYFLDLHITRWLQLHILNFMKSVIFQTYFYELKLADIILRSNYESNYWYYSFHFSSVQFTLHKIFVIASWIRMTQPTIEIIWLTDKMNTMFIDIDKNNQQQNIKTQKEVQNIW